MSLEGAQRVMLSGLAHVGLDARALCTQAGVDPRTLDDADVALEPGMLARVLACAESLSGDSLLGLHIAERAPERGVLCYLARSQRTLGDALRAFEQFATGWWELERPVRVEPRGSAIFVGLGMRRATPRHALEYLVARIARSLARSGAQVCETRFAHAPAGPPREYERALRCPVRFEQAETGVLLRASDLARPLCTANPEAAEALAAALAPRARRSAPSTSERLAGAVEQALEQGGRPDRELLARTLGMSGRTLARRLASEHTSFRDVVEQVRRSVAARLVAQDSLDLAEIAARSGFADRAAFGRAFRRWFGECPSAYRARQRAA